MTGGMIFFFGRHKLGALNKLSNALHAQGLALLKRHELTTFLDPGYVTGDD
jgi:hypothetical protein